VAGTEEKKGLWGRGRGEKKSLNVGNPPKVKKIIAEREFFIRLKRRSSQEKKTGGEGEKQSEMRTEEERKRSKRGGKPPLTKSQFIDQR